MKNTKFLTRILAASVAAAMLFTGCGIKGSNETFATFGDEKITLGFANFIAHYQQATYDQLYLGFVGEDYWSQDLYGSGNNMETDIKAEIAEAIKEQYVLDKHKDEYGVSVSDEDQKKIDEAVEKFFAVNDKKAIDRIGATKEYVAEYLRLGLVSSRMSSAVKETLDPGYTMEDAAQKGITYMQVGYVSTYDDEGNTKEYTEDEKAEITAAVEAIAGGEASELESAAEAAGYTVIPTSFGEDDTVVPDIVKEEVAKMNVGDMSGVLDNGERYYIVRYDSEYDEEATKDHLESMTSAAETTAYQELIDKWGSEVTWEINEDAWSKVKFNVLFVSPESEEENEEG